MNTPHNDNEEAMAEETQKEVTRVQLARSQQDMRDDIKEYTDKMLTQGEANHLIGVKEANPHYFAAVLKASEIMSERRAKYSGTGDPFTNFYLMKDMLQTWFGDRLELNMADIFAYYISLKFARYIVSGDKDFKDDSALDTLRDLANYALLAMGHTLKPDNEKL